MPGVIVPALVGETAQARPGVRSAEPPAGQGLVEVVTGAEAVARRLSRLWRDAVDEVCALLTSGPWDVAAAPLEAGSGVRHRVVVERGAAERARERPAAARVRVVDRVPAGLLVADREVAVLALGPGAEEPAALVVRAGLLLDSLLDLFEQVWRAGRPPRPADDPAARPGPTDGPDATDLAVLSLLLAGVTTRLQLGWAAAERGWTTVRARSGQPAADSSASSSRLRSSPPA